MRNQETKPIQGPWPQRDIEFSPHTLCRSTDTLSRSHLQSHVYPQALPSEMEKVHHRSTMKGRAHRLHNPRVISPNRSPRYNREGHGLHRERQDPVPHGEATTTTSDAVRQVPRMFSHRLFAFANQLRQRCLAMMRRCSRPLSRCQRCLP